jgi:hypothetical protein
LQLSPSKLLLSLQLLLLYVEHTSSARRVHVEHATVLPFALTSAGCCNNAATADQGPEEEA